MAMNKRAPAFVMDANDAGVWRRVLEKMTDQHGPFDEWDQKAWSAANMYYRRAYDAQGGTKYQTGEKVAYIMADGTPVVQGGDFRPDLGPAQYCGSCNKAEQFYKDDYMCAHCRDALSFSGAAA